MEKPPVYKSLTPIEATIISTRLEVDKKTMWIKNLERILGF